jgi:hypothetical protein
MAGAFQRHVAGIIGNRAPAGKATSVANQFLRQLESRVDGGIQDKRQLEHRGLSTKSHQSSHAAVFSADPSATSTAAESNSKTLQCLFDSGVEAPVQVKWSFSFESLYLTSRPLLNTSWIFHCKSKSNQ